MSRSGTYGPEVEQVRRPIFQPSKLVMPVRSRSPAPVFSQLTGCAARREGPRARLRPSCRGNSSGGKAKPTCPTAWPGQARPIPTRPTNWRCSSAIGRSRLVSAVWRSCTSRTQCPLRSTRRNRVEAFRPKRTRECGSSSAPTAGTTGAQPTNSPRNYELCAALTQASRRPGERRLLISARLARRRRPATSSASRARAAFAPNDSPVGPTTGTLRPPQ